MLCNRRTATTHACTSTCRVWSLAGAVIEREVRFNSVDRAVVRHTRHLSSNQLVKLRVNLGGGSINTSCFSLGRIPQGDKTTPAVPSQPRHARSSTSRHVWQNRLPTLESNSPRRHPLTHPTTPTASPLHRITHTHHSNEFPSILSNPLQSTRSAVHPVLTKNKNTSQECRCRWPTASPSVPLWQNASSTTTPPPSL